jgi:outer membrane receptor protein involved in Fe transport
LGRIDDWIQWAPGSGAFWQAENLATVHTRGVEVRAEAEGKKSSAQHVQGYGVLIYGYTHARQNNGEYLLYQPAHRASTMAGVRYKTYSLGMRQQSSGWRPASSDAGEWLPAYAVLALDASASVDLAPYQIQVQLSLENLTNAYVESVARRPMPGRAFRVQLILRHQP